VRSSNLSLAHFKISKKSSSALVERPALREGEEFKSLPGPLISTKKKDIRLHKNINIKLNIKL
jgi:hypothetical protein